MLDDERNACRVIARNDKGTRLVFDFTQMRGETLKDDLLERDFTINAMAVDLDHPFEIIDPLNGSEDLTHKWLRLCKASSFSDDPLRVIRAVRYSVKYDLRLEPSTIRLLTDAVKDLPKVSKERKRDELFKILEGHSPSRALELFDQYQIFQYVGLKGLTDTQSALQRLQIFAEICVSMKEGETADKNKKTNHLSLGSLFTDSRASLRERINLVNQSDRSIHALDGLISLLWDFDEVEGAKVAEVLSLSREEQEHVTLCLRHKCCIMDHFSSHQEPGRKFLYRYYQSLGIVGVDLAILTLVEAVRDLSLQWNADRWEVFVLFCQKIIETWFKYPEYINPRLLLTGRDLMFEFDIPQGPRIGQLLDGLREEQAIGSIQNRTQALAWVEDQLQKSFISR